MLSAGAVIGHYRLEAEVGHGGMGIVYRAWDMAQERPAALKLLSPHLTGDPQSLARFRTEAASVARLEHPHIARFYEFGEQDGQAYIALEWIDGLSLQALLAEQGALPLERALRLVEQVAGALDYIHRNGVVHRDIKPANILITAGDTPYLVDFGIVWFDPTQSATLGDGMVGTPRYMSPEEIQGLELDGRSDQYSLAVVLYEMLAGRPPFTGEGIPALLHDHVFALPAPISELNPALPGAVETALQRALAKRPEDRFPGVLDFVAALRAPSPAARRRRTRGSIAGSRPAPGARRRPTWLYWLILGAFLPVCLIGLVVLLDAAPWESKPRSTPSDLTVPTSLPSAIRWQQEYNGVSTGVAAGGGQILLGTAEGKVIALDQDTGRAVWETALGSSLAGRLAIGRGGAGDSVFCTTAGDGLVALSLHGGRVLWRLPAQEIEGQVSDGVTAGEDGALYLATDAGWLYVVDAQRGGIAWSLRVADGESFAWAPALSSQTAFLAGAAGAVYAVDLEKRDVAWSVSLPDRPTARPLPGESGEWLCLGTDGGLFVLDPKDGATLWQAAAGERVVGLAHYANYIYAAMSGGEVSAWSGASGRLYWTASLAAAPLLPPLTDGRMVLAASASGRLVYLDASNGGPKGELSFPGPISGPPVVARNWLFLYSSPSVYGVSP